MRRTYRYMCLTTEREESLQNAFLLWQWYRCYTVGVHCHTEIFKHNIITPLELRIQVVTEFVVLSLSYE